MGKVNKKSYFKTKKSKERIQKAKDRLACCYERIRGISDESQRLKSEHNYVQPTGNTSNSQHNHIHPTNAYIEDQTPLSIREEPWRKGRHVIELDVLADGLSACKNCGQPLQLHHATSIIHYGLGGVLKIPCYNQICGRVNHISTGKIHGRIWDVNTKLVSAMMHAGIGERQLNSILSELNIPTVSKTLIYERQKEAGAAINTVARESTHEAVKEEIKATKQKSSCYEGLTVSTDGAWQKRGSGRAFDSLSGHCTMIGKATGKVIDFSLRSKFCKICDIADRKQEKPKPHTCLKNWEGSSKAMESDMVIEMVTAQEEAGNRISTIVADDDTTTISRLRKIMTHTIKKKSDKNHVKKNISAKLMSLKQKHRCLSQSVVDYLRHCLNYMLSQNQGNEEGVSKGLDALSLHPFGDHSLCGDWCEHVENPNKKYRLLPYGKPLKDQSLQISLKSLFDDLKCESEKLANLGSTQSNESLNSTIATKAPKSHFFSGSSSLYHRVAAGVAQKNIGHSYITKVNIKIGLSPGGYTLRLARVRDLQNKKRKAIDIVTAKKAKRRRRELKARRLQANRTKETREGASYSSGVSSSAVSGEAITQIPPPKFPPSVHSECPVSTSFTPVFWDLETTGLERTCHITQVAVMCGELEWSSYVQPKKPLSKGASGVTGIEMIGRQMFHNGKPVSPLSVSCVIESLLSFLEKAQSLVYLVGHNIKVFDCPVLFNALKNVDKVTQFTDIVKGFVDTKILFKQKKPGLSSYSQENLFKEFTGKEYDAHDALEDVKALKELSCKSGIQLHSCPQAVFDCEYVSLSLEHSMRIAKNLPSFSDLVDKQVLSKCMARKAAGSDLSAHCLRLAFERHGIDGVKDMMAEKCEIGVRVTKSSRIIQAIANYFSEP